MSGAADGRGLWAALEQAPVDLIVLDLMLPGDDGLVLCRNLRARSQIPIIMLTARGDDTDRIVGLEMGADDYLSKPFNPASCWPASRGTAAKPQHSPANRANPSASHFAGWSLDVASRQLIAPDEVRVPLGTSEYRLLQVFLEHPQRC